MTKAILSVGALLAAAVALAGCGGGSSASGTVTTGGVAGASTTKTAAGSGTFSTSVHGFAGRLQTSVKTFENGNVSAAASSGGSLLSNCTGTVNGKIAPQASGAAQRKAVTHLRVSCGDMSKAVRAGTSGNLMKAREFARAALKQAQIAAKLSG